MRTHYLGALALLLLLTGCTGDELMAGGEVTDLPGGRRLAVETVGDYRLVAQVEDEDGDVSDEVTVYLSDTGRRDQGRFRIIDLRVQVAGETVVVRAELVPDDLPEGEDFEDLSRGLVAVSDDLDHLDDWAVVDEADPVNEPVVAEDGSEVRLPLEDGSWVWRGGTFERVTR